MTSLFECDLENQRLAEEGIVFVCPNSRCPLSLKCPYAERTRIIESEEGGAEMKLKGIMFGDQVYETRKGFFPSCHYCALYNEEDGCQLKKAMRHCPLMNNEYFVLKEGGAE